MTRLDREYKAARRWKIERRAATRRKRRAQRRHARSRA